MRLLRRPWSRVYPILFPLAAGLLFSGQAVDSRQELEDVLLPRPQYLEDKGFNLTLDRTWQIALDTSDPEYAFAGRWFNDKAKTIEPLVLDIIDGRNSLPGAKQIVVGNPAEHEHVRDVLLRRGRTLPSSVGDEGYLLEVFDDDSAEVIVAANTPAGAFYGVVTLLQLIDTMASLPGVMIVDYPEHQLRGSYEPGSARLELTDNEYRFTDGYEEFIDWLAGHKFNAFFPAENGAFFKPEEVWRGAYEEMFAYARQRHLEPIPRICSISTVSPFEFEYYEGWYVQDEHFTFDDSHRAVANIPFEDLIVNGDFETDADADGAPDGWIVSDRPGATWTIDESTAYSGSRSMRLDIPSPASESNSATLRTSVSDIHPDSYYCLWAKARAQDIVDVRPQLTFYVRNTEREVTVLQSDVTWSTPNWKDFGSCIRTPPDSDSLTLYSRIQYPGTGTFWLDDVHVYRVSGGLRNVIRANDTDIAVTDLTGTVTYVEGRDYGVINGGTSIKFVPTLAPFRILRLAGGDIAHGEEVLVSYNAYFYYMASQYWRSAPAVSRDELYTEYYYPAIDKVVEYLEPKYINIDADEVRGFYRDSRMTDTFDGPAEAIAYWANRIADYLAARDPDARLWIWDDMVSPYHNGGAENYQVRYGGLPGRMAEATEEEWIDKSIIMDVWWYGDSRISQMWHSIEYFGRKGYDVLGSPWQSEENIISWSEMLLGVPHSLGGVETNWSTPFEEPHRQFADNFWNTQYGLVLFDSFEDDADENGVPDGWRKTGDILYSTDGSMSQGTRYVEFPNSAVGITTTTASFASELLEVRPNTEYVLSEYVKQDGDGSPSAHMIVEWYDADDGLISGESAVITNLEQDYMKYEFEVTSPPDAAFASVRLDESAPGAWYDIIRLKERTLFFGIVGPEELGDAIAGIPFNARIDAAGGVAPYRWTLGTGELPPGLQLTDGGALTGLPVEPGAFSFSLTTTDAANRSDARDYVLLVGPRESAHAVHIPFAANS